MASGIMVCTFSRGVRRAGVVATCSGLLRPVPQPRSSLPAVTGGRTGVFRSNRDAGLSGTVTRLRRSFPARCPCADRTSCLPLYGGLEWPCGGDPDLPCGRGGLHFSGGRVADLPLGHIHHREGGKAGQADRMAVGNQFLHRRLDAAGETFGFGARTVQLFGDGGVKRCGGIGLMKSGNPIKNMLSQFKVTTGVWNTGFVSLVPVYEFISNSQAPCPIGLRGFVPSEPCDDLRW